MRKKLLIVPIVGLLILSLSVLNSAAPAWASAASHPSSTASAKPLPFSPESIYYGPGAAPADPSARTLLVVGPSFQVYADTAVRGVVPLHITASGAAAAAQVAASPQLVNNCGFLSCSIYFSRSETKQINNDIALAGGGIGGLAAACTLLALFPPPAGVILAAVCAAGVALEGAFFLNALTHAAGDNGCLRIRYGIDATPPSFYDDHSGYCMN